ncbi:2-dehydro-3-deoxygluconokinase [Natranaerovirga pectinivora]|uniref:2-dehydro-3-deoxygluconokinase n=1 Tax=Natranaerovirga pectinivora TaxID=682400 RepID=A0A4R3MI87_9FIRM|nr:sugar kinase [Natranaerovirga pectinivora]TCT13828.1 2-dehydro-3-deoxygluconokinase [Natranaerovirga pectinivora]
MSSVVTMGEIMLRLSPPLYHKIEQTNNYSSTYGGGEANVAIALSHLGRNTCFISKLPANQLGDGAIVHLRGYGVNTENIARAGENIGIYFLENGFGTRASQVIYNRKHSAITDIDESEFDFDKIFKDVEWFHISGITLALGENVRRVALIAMKKAKEHNVKVSFDFNYRSKLWSIEEAKEAMQEIMPMVDVCFGSYFDANVLLEIEPSKEYDNDEDKRMDVFNQLIDKYGVKYVFGTKRELFSANENSLWSYAYTKDAVYRTESTRFNIFDRVGGGDAFVSGVIHKLLDDYEDFKFANEFGLACSILKHTIPGDASILREKEITKFMSNLGSEIVR